MSVIGEFTVPSGSFLLGETLQTFPDVVVELQQVVAHGENRLVPYFWVNRGELERFDEAIHGDDTLESVTRLDQFERGTSYRGTWTKHASAIVYAYVEAGATILAATGQDDSWTLRMWFEDDRSVTDFNRYCEEEGLPFSLNQLYHPTEPMAGGQFGLTETQRETLVTAYSRGYFEVPRAVTMTELADELGVTQQTLSARFRRAYASLVENTLLISDEAAMQPSDGSA